jgi:hypothetical protein
MTARRLASSRYGKRCTRDRERTRSRISIIHEATNFGNSNDVQYENHNEISSTHGIHRQINLRGCRNKKYESSERFVNNTIEQSIQHEKLMLN